jgi:dCTP deaminase
MILSGNAIMTLLTQCKIKIEPEPEIKEASIKIHFSQSFTIKPKEFLTTTSIETIEIPEDLAGLYDGYSHLARKGVTTHLGSMFIDPGFKGNITLEVFNVSDKEVNIESGERAGHLILFEVKN